MPVLAVLVIILGIGFLVWLTHSYLGPYVDARWLKLFDIVAIVGTIWWLLVVSGIWGYLASLRF